MKVSKKVKITKFYARDVVNENEHPYRTCKDAIFLHLWPRTMVITGKWEKQTRDELEALMTSVEGEDLGDWSPESITAGT